MKRKYNEAMDGDNNAQQVAVPVKGIDLLLYLYSEFHSNHPFISDNPLEKVHSSLFLPLSAFFNEKVRQ